MILSATNIWNFFISLFARNYIATYLIFRHSGERQRFITETLQKETVIINCFFQPYMYKMTTYHSEMVVLSYFCSSWMCLRSDVTEIGPAAAVGEKLLCKLDTAKMYMGQTVHQLLTGVKNFCMSDHKMESKAVDLVGANLRLLLLNLTTEVLNTTRQATKTCWWAQEFPRGHKICLITVICRRGVPWNLLNDDSKTIKEDITGYRASMRANSLGPTSSAGLDGNLRSDTRKLYRSNR